MLHDAGVPREQISIISRNHDEESRFAADLNVTPGAEIEDSALASRLGELSGVILAAIALVLPGIGPIVAAGPLSAGLGEAAGHVAGGVASALRGAGVDGDRADALEKGVRDGAILLGVHTDSVSGGRRKSPGPGRWRDPGGTGELERMIARCVHFARSSVQCK